MQIQFELVLTELATREGKKEKTERQQGTAQPLLGLSLH
jgi:hypothetical protein